MKLPRTLAGKNCRAGFTLIEAIVATGVLFILFASGLPIAANFYLDYQLDSETSLLTSVLQYARNLSIVNHNESDHGLYLDSKNFVIFQGSSFASRVQGQDKAFPRERAITISGPSELIFTVLSGQTASSTYAVSDGRKTKYVYVNTEGLIY